MEDQKKNEQEGVVIMIKSEYRDQIKDCRYVSHRILEKKMRVQGRTITIIREKDAPEDCKHHAQKETFYDELQTTLEREWKRNEQSILID